MKEIIELNNRLLREAKGHLPNDGLMLEREGGADDCARLPARSRKEIDDLRAELNEVIPDDFNYLLYLGDESPALRLEYHNGATSAAGRGHEWEDALSVVDQLRALDWDDERKWAIQGSEMFDQIAAIAEKMPVMIPPTKALQKQNGERVKDYIKEKRRDPSLVHVLLWDDEGNLLDNDFVDLKTFERELPDIMTCMLHVVTVVAEGKPLSLGRIDRLKKAALQHLEDMPISHAKASGKFAFIMAYSRCEEQV
ncbi:MAG: hypothetical protein ABI946_03445 [Chthoniobacterales bacterium]